MEKVVDIFDALENNKKNKPVGIGDEFVCLLHGTRYDFRIIKTDSNNVALYLLKINGKDSKSIGTWNYQINVGDVKKITENEVKKLFCEQTYWNCACRVSDGLTIEQIFEERKEVEPIKNFDLFLYECGNTSIPYILIVEVREFQKVGFLMNILKGATLNDSILIANAKNIHKQELICMIGGRFEIDELSRITYEELKKTSPYC